MASSLPKLPALELIKRASRQNLASILSGLRYFGLGARVAKKDFIYPDSYWVITKSKLTADQKGVEAVATLIWKGSVTRKDRKLLETDYKQWVLLGVPDYSKFRGTDEHCKKIIDDTFTAYRLKAAAAREAASAVDATAMQETKSV
jgi:hypothetical protein